jgi:two-component system cell cycle sensor histidine kinase/response regulator CckA
MQSYKAEELAQALFEESGDALILFDPENERILDANLVAQRLSGFSRADMLGLPASHLFRSEIQGRLNRLRQAYRKTGIFHAQDGFLLRTAQDGAWVPVNLTVTRLHVQPKTLCLITARDVRDQQDSTSQLKKVEAELRRVLASVSDCLWSADIEPNGQWVYRYFSPVVERITGQPVHFFLAGMHRWWSLIHPEDRLRWEKMVMKLKAGQSYQEEYRVVWPDGSSRWVRDSVMVSPGAVKGDAPSLKLDGVLTDITERKRAELAVQRRANELQAVSQISRMLLQIDSEKALLDEAPPVLRNLFGFEVVLVQLQGLPEDSASASSSVGLPTEELAAVLEPAARTITQAVQQSGRMLVLNDYCRRPDADDVLLRQLKIMTVVAFPLATGKDVVGTLLLATPQTRQMPSSLLGALQTVANLMAQTVERARAQEALLAREELFRALVEKSTEAVALIDAQGTICYASDSTTRLLGYEQNEIVGHGMVEFFHPEEKNWMLEQFQRCLDHPGLDVHAEFRFLHRDGSWRFMEGVGINRLDEPSVKAVVANFRDISERKRHEAALHQSNERLRALIEASPLAIIWVDAQDTVMGWNRAAEEMFGWKAAEIRGGPIPPELREQAGALRRVQRGQPITGLEARQQRRDGSWLDVSISAAPVYDASGQLAGIMGVVADITERKRAEEAVRHSEQRYRLLFERNLAGVSRTTVDGHLLDCNDSFARILGLPNHEALLDRNVTDFYYDPGERDVFLAQLRLANTLTNYETCLRRPDGSQVWVLENVSLLRGEDGSEFLEGTLVDITERKRLEEHLRQVQKMDAIGQLAGGVAHDFNNLLTAILGNVGLLQSSLAPDDPNREMLAVTEKAANRAAELTRQLLGFSRQTMLRLEPTTLNKAIEEVLAIFSRTLEPRVQLKVNLEPQVWTVLADLGQMAQVLMNLCLNARDAMPEGGRLVLETENVTLDADYADRHLEAQAGDFVRLRVSDTGHGIPPEIQPRIFDPFFTTKEVGKGTGLGLAMVFGIIKQHNGWIDCYSEVSQGTRFDIYLPRCQQEADPAPLPSPGTVGSGETILLADDESFIRTLGRTILERAGYTVLTAEDGQQAVEIYQQTQPPIDLVILDLTMPTVSGREALRLLRQYDPHVRVVLASGYSAEHLDDRERCEALAFISKPYRPQDLVRTVQAALDRARAGERR